MIKRLFYLLLNNPGRLWYQLRFLLLVPSYLQDVKRLLRLQKKVEYLCEGEIDVDKIMFSHSIVFGKSIHLDDNPINVFKMSCGSYLVLDGNHRLAYQKYELKLKKIPVHIFILKKDNCNLRLL